MGQESNLTPNARRTREELRKMGEKGGKASGEARKRNKATKLLIREFLNSRPKASRAEMERLDALGYELEKQGAPTLQTLIYAKIAEQAREGNLEYVEYLNRYAHIPDLRAQLERERIKAQAQTRAKVDLTVDAGEGEAVLEQIRARMRGDGE